MKKSVVFILCFASKVLLCEDDQSVGPVKSILKKTDTQWTDQEQDEFRRKELEARNKRDREDILLEESLAKDPDAISYVADRKNKIKGYVLDESQQKISRLNQRSRNLQMRTKLTEQWQKSSERDLPKRTSRVKFNSTGDSFSPVEQEGKLDTQGTISLTRKAEFNPRDVSTWDLNRFKKITVEDMRNLSKDQVAQLLAKPDYLKSLKPEQLQAINPVLFLQLSDEPLVEILNDQNLIKKFTEEQVLAMKYNVHLDHLTVGELRLLLQKPEFLNVLNRDQIRKINPETLSKVLYNKLSEKLDDDFVDKLSDQQIGQLYYDHIKWGFHNWGTSFKQNFTPAALDYIESFEDPLFGLNRLPKLKF